MRLILTHEQADFDALAGLLGVSLLQEGDIPILPNRTNRNVRTYLSLYRDEFPFTEHQDLPSESIDRITLVDTQSLVTIKGVNRSTLIRVIDHHQAKLNLDPSWEVEIESTGAVTTLVVEALQKIGRSITPTQANLLLLGIYEDTGSLTYASTTPRDVRAAAYLMEIGANLKIVSTHLNPPLSTDQHQLYEKLIEQAKSIHIHGQKIVVSHAEALDLNEEISSIAHKLRDMLEPQGLVILVATSEGYRLVMRSTTDYFNVAGLAAHFDGGGHERASAALVHRNADEDTKSTARIPEILAELDHVLPKYVKPSLTVAQMMSHRPRLISPDLTAQEAAKLMQRYGYEGFPVVRDHLVIGLLTRRAVDRAINHKLNLKASSLMESGSVTVKASSSLVDVQNLMMETGWGQIPVVNEENTEIIGIITRTDIIKSINRVNNPHHQRSLLTQLQDALPIEQIKLLKLISKYGSKRNASTYVVGGFVRDLILKKPVFDYDIVVEGDAIKLAKDLSADFGGRVVMHSRFGTAKWYLNEQVLHDLRLQIPEIEDARTQLPASLDLISARTEFYERPTALPVVERSGIKLDLHRRDFTINTLAIKLDENHFGELIDGWGGYADIQHKLIRVLHSLSFIDDPTRILRAVRFEQRFHFAIEDRTMELMAEASDQLKAITGERIRHEFDLIFDENDPSIILTRLCELGLLSKIQAGLTWNEKKSAALGHLLNSPLPPYWSLPEKLWGIPTRRILAYACWFADLPDETVTALSRRLHLPAHMVQVIGQSRVLSNQVDTLVNAKPSAIVSILETNELLAQLVVRSIKTDQRITKLLDQYQETWRHVKTSLDGEDLIRKGFTPGPNFREILTRLRYAVLDGEIDPGDDELMLLKELTERDLK